jgi:predicted PurR-regulated permease PerM
LKSSVVGLLVATAVLYFAQEVLIPVALAVLLAFLLAPAVRRLEQWKLGRLPSALLVSLLAFAVVFLVVGVAATQAVALGAKLPEYRQNIVEKIHALRQPKRDSNIGKAAEAIKDLEEEAAPERPPIPVKESPGSPVEAFGEFIAPVAKPLATTFAVIILTILLLLNREGMRERAISLAGPGRIHVMTKAMAEASYRVSRYLVTQIAVNAMFGIPFGIALWLIGIPNALLFGLLGMVLRFIPYAGVWIAVAMPAALAFAISDTWTPVAWTLGVFFALEIVLAYVIEPWLYGKSAGLSPIAIIMAVLFWTWLWGPVGLLLATPLTVCVSVIGRYIPELGYLNTLLGVEAVLSPDQRFYQRLLALDQEEATEVAEAHAASHGAAATFEEVIMPALVLAGRDRDQGALEPARERYIFENIQRIVAELELPDAPAPSQGVCIAAAHDGADMIAAQMLGRLLATDCVVAPPAMPVEVGDLVKRHDCKTVLVSALPPHAASHAGALARRLKGQLNGTKIVAGVWNPDEDGRSTERLGRLGVDAVVTRFSEALEAVKK